ncbi:MAG: alpha/beta fold hydrolase [Streptosporangiaceae bacterium]
MPGHGRTPDAGRPLRYELLADDLAALLDHLGLARADVFGYSLGGAVAVQLAIRHPARVRRLVAMSVTYDTAGLHPEFAAADAGASDEAISQLRDSPYHRAYQDVAADPREWDTLVARVLELDRQPQHWPARQIEALTAPVMLVVADNDIVRLEHAVDMVRLLGGGIAGDLHGLPAARLAVIPATTREGTGPGDLRRLVRALVRDGVLPDGAAGQGRGRADAVRAGRRRPGVRRVHR